MLGIRGTIPGQAEPVHGSVRECPGPRPKSDFQVVLGGVKKFIDHGTAL